MNLINLTDLQTTLMMLGFGAALPQGERLKAFIVEQPKSLELFDETRFSNDCKIEATLYIRRSGKEGNYFLCKYQTHLKYPEDHSKNRTYTFYGIDGMNVSFREAFNLLQGRCVNKDLTSSEGTKYNAWIKLNFAEKDDQGNYKLMRFRHQYGYNLERVLEKYPITELQSPGHKGEIIASLKKGNRHPVTFFKPSDKTERKLIEANPVSKTIIIYPVRSKVTMMPNDKERA